MPYAVSGSWAATQFAAVAPPRLLLLYTDSIPEVVTSLDLRPADAGGNVALAAPFDTVVYERTSTRQGIVVSALSQVVAAATVVIPVLFAVDIYVPTCAGHSSDVYCGTRFE